MNGADTASLARISLVVAERLGLHFPEERWGELARGIAIAGAELGFTTPQACLQWIQRPEITTAELEALAGRITVGETYFYREPESFEALEQVILPALAASHTRSGAPIRIWSAGCATGEEAYSVAISCLRALAPGQARSTWIMGTDLNARFLAKAAEGVYSRWSFRDAPSWLVEGFFTPMLGGVARIRETVKNMVHFRYLNLAEDTYPSLHTYTNAMDVILCRNVLMYLTPAHQDRVVRGLHGALVDGGYLLVNPIEITTLCRSLFTVESVGRVLVCRKRAQVTHASEAVPPAVPSEDPWRSSGSGASRESERLEEPVAGQPPSPEGPLQEARRLANLGWLAEAQEACLAAIRGAPTDPAGYALLADVCKELGALDQAAAALRTVLYLDGERALAHYALGGVYRDLGRLEAARRHLAIALEILSGRDRDELVPDSDGMTCGRLAESVRAMQVA